MSDRGRFATLAATLATFAATLAILAAHLAVFAMIVAAFAANRQRQSWQTRLNSGIEHGTAATHHQKAAKTAMLTIPVNFVPPPPSSPSASATSATSAVQFSSLPPFSPPGAGVKTLIIRPLP
jgi:hypothetical protein